MSGKYLTLSIPEKKTRQMKKHTLVDAKSIMWMMETSLVKHAKIYSVNTFTKINITIINVNIQNGLI